VTNHLDAVDIDAKLQSEHECAYLLCETSNVSVTFVVETHRLDVRTDRQTDGRYDFNMTPF
jgi:hypothetical protein